MKPKLVSIFLAGVLTLLLVAEYILIRFQPTLSGLALLKSHFREAMPFQVTTAPSGFFGLTMAGLGSFCFFATFCYSLRKRLPFMRSLGTLTGWVDAHVFFGCMGPILILIHTDFKQRGLAGIAFWSMAVVFISGIFGHVFERPKVFDRKKGKTVYRWWFLKNQAIVRHWDAFHGPFAILFLLSALSHITLGLLFLVQREAP